LKFNFIYSLLVLWVDPIARSKVEKRLSLLAATKGLEAFFAPPLGLA
jgi:hypothetical protein